MRNRIIFRVEPDLNELIRAKAKEERMTLTAFIIQSILYKYPELKDQTNAKKEENTKG